MVLPSGLSGHKCTPGYPSWDPESYLGTGWPFLVISNLCHLCPFFHIRDHCWFICGQNGNHGAVSFNATMSMLTCGSLNKDCLSRGTTLAFLLMGVQELSDSLHPLPLLPCFRHSTGLRDIFYICPLHGQINSSAVPGAKLLRTEVTVTEAWGQSITF